MNRAELSFDLHESSVNFFFNELNRVELSYRIKIVFEFKFVNKSNRTWTFIYKN